MTELGKEWIRSGKEGTTLPTEGMSDWSEALYEGLQRRLLGSKVIVRAQ